MGATYDEAEAKVFGDDVPRGADLVLDPQVVDGVPPREQQVQPHRNRHHPVHRIPAHSTTIVGRVRRWCVRRQCVRRCVRWGVLVVDDGEDEESPAHDEGSVGKVFEVEAQHARVELHAVPQVRQYIAVRLKLETTNASAVSRGVCVCRVWVACAAVVCVRVRVRVRVRWCVCVCGGTSLEKKRPLM